MWWDKLVTLTYLDALCKDLDHLSRRIVFTNGCFDILHVGHLRMLQQAKHKGDILIVGLNSDKSVKEIKGADRPIIPQTYRAEMLCGFECVDYVVIFDDSTPIKVIRSIRPDILCKGSEWRYKYVTGSDIVKQKGGEMFFYDHVDGISTTDIIQQIRGEQ